jgi:GTPase-associated system helical domain
MADSTNAATMHPDFPRWYREVGVEENRDRIKCRWAGTSSLVENFTIDDVEPLLRLVFHAKVRPSADSLSRVRQFYKDADDLFDMKGNDREMEVLGGTALAVLLEKSGGIVANIALAVTTTALEGARVVQLPMDLGALAETAIARIAEAQRARPTRPKLTFKKAKEALSQFDTAGVSNAFDSAAEAINSAFASSDRFIAIQDEELEMLWWVLNERSEDLGKAFEDLPAKARPLILAKELAQATAFSPGPRSVKGLLWRSGLTDTKKISIADAVNDCEFAARLHELFRR